MFLDLRKGFGVCMRWVLHTVLKFIPLMYNKVSQNYEMCPQITFQRAKTEASEGSDALKWGGSLR